MLGLLAAIRGCGEAGASDSSASIHEACVEIAATNHDERGAFMLRHGDWLIDSCIVSHAMDVKAIDPNSTMNVVERANRLADSGMRGSGYEAMNVGTVYWLTMQWIKLPPCWGADRHGHLFTVEMTTFHNLVTNRVQPAALVDWLGWLESALFDRTQVPHCDLPPINIG